MSYYIYKITNIINGKIYFGKAKNIKKRWNNHKTAAKSKQKKDYSHLHKAMNKYGFNNFIIEQVEEFEHECDALIAEINYIKNNNARDPNIGYNISEGGDGLTGYHHTDASKKLMSDNKKGKFKGKDNWFYKKHHSIQTKNIISKKQKENYLKNKSKYDALNITQCMLSTEQCIEIQAKYLTGKYSMKQLCNEYCCKITAIHSIIHGTYFAIRNYSIISKTTFEQIKKMKNKELSIKKHKFSIEDENLIIKDYLDGNTISLIKEKWKASSPTISKILKKHNIKILRGPTQKSPKNTKLSDKIVIEIIKKYASNNYTYKSLSLEYNVSKQVISRIIQGKTWVHLAAACADNVHLLKLKSMPS